MDVQKRALKAIARSRKLARATETVLLGSLRAEMATVRTFLFLVKRESGAERFHHLKQARIGLQEIHKLATRVRPTNQDLIEIEELRQEIVSLSTSPRPQQEF